MSLNIGNGSDNLGVDLDAMQIAVGTYILVVIVQQNGRVVKGREAESGNTESTQETTVCAAGTDMWSNLQIAVNESEKKSESF